MATITRKEVETLASLPTIELVRRFGETSGTNPDGLATLFKVEQPDPYLSIAPDAIELMNELFGKYVVGKKYKDSPHNPWEFNIRTDELRGYIYVADAEEEGLVLMSEYELSTGEIVDVEIIGISDDFEAVTVSTATNFSWGQYLCKPHENLRSAYLEVC